MVKFDARRPERSVLSRVAVGRSTLNISQAYELIAPL